MTLLDVRRRNRTIAALGAGVVALALVPVLGWVAADNIRTSTEGRDALEGLAPLVTLPATPTALLAGLDEQGKVATLTVFARSPQDGGSVPGGTVVVVPAGGDTFLDEETRGRVADAYVNGGLPNLRSAVEGLLGITFDIAAAVPAAGLSQLLPFAPLEFNLDHAIVDDGLGGPTELFPSGPTALSTEDIGAFLTAATTSESEVAKMPSLDGFWRAVAERVGSGRSLELPASAVTGATDPDDAAAFVSFLDQLFAGPLQVHTLSAERVTDPDDNPDGVDLIHLDTAEVNVVFATVAFSAVSPPNPTISIYVRSPLGDPALTKEAVGRLILAGANVVLVTESPDLAVPATTEVEYVDDNDASESKRFGAQLGTFTSARSQVRIDGVDAIVTLGRSFADAAAKVGTATTAEPATTDTTETTTG